MLKTDYNIPIFEDTDAADLNKYSNEMANALKTQINNTNNEIKEIDQKVVDAVNKFAEPLSYKGSVLNYDELPTTNTNGDIYTVTSENKNYIWNGTEWVEYSSNLDLAPIENQLKTEQTTDIAEALTITDCAGVNGSLDIKEGKTIQEGTPTPDTPIEIRNVGDNVNLFNIDTIEFGWIKAGVVSLDAKNICSDYIYLEPNCNYTISLKTSVKEISYALYDENKTYIKTTYNSTNIVSDTSKRYIRFWVNYDGSTTMTKELVKTLEIKLEKGLKAKNYSEYNCGSVGFRTENKNKLNMINHIETLRGVTATTENSEIVLNGTVTQAGYVLRKTNLAKLQAGTYTFKFYINQNEITIPSGGAIAFTLQNSDTNKNILEETFAGDRQGTFTLDTETNIGIDIYANKTNTVFNNATIKIQIEEGDTATDYIESQRQDIVFPLSEGQLLHKGDYLAKDGIHQKRETIVLTGNETTWTTRLAGEIRLFEIYVPKYGFGNTSDNFSCFSHFKNNLDLTEDYTARVMNNLLAIHYDDVSTVEQWKSYLAEQYANGTPVTIEYELATETITPYTSEQEQAYYELQHLLMYEGYTSIECIDEIKPDIQVTYLYNNELNTSYGKYIDKLSLEIHELKKQVADLTAMVLSN